MILNMRSLKMLSALTRIPTEKDVFLENLHVFLKNMSVFIYG